MAGMWTYQHDGAIDLGEPVDQSCHTCAGTGECPACRGLGEREVGDGDDLALVDCATCDSLGDCPSCDWDGVR